MQCGLSTWKSQFCPKAIDFNTQMIFMYLSMIVGCISGEGSRWRPRWGLAIIGKLFGLGMWSASITFHLYFTHFSQGKVVVMICRAALNSRKVRSGDCYATDTNFNIWHGLKVNSSYWVLIESIFWATIMHNWLKSKREHLIIQVRLYFFACSSVISV